MASLNLDFTLREQNAAAVNKQNAIAQLLSFAFLLNCRVISFISFFSVFLFTPFTIGVTQIGAFALGNDRWFTKKLIAEIMKSGKYERSWAHFFHEFVLYRIFRNLFSDHSVLNGLYSIFYRRK